MKFKRGKPSDAIVTDEPIDDLHKQIMTVDGGYPGNLVHYGGYVVCESVHPKLMPLLLAAPDLLAACQAVLKWAHTPQSEPGGGFDTFAEGIVPMIDELITRVTGEEAQP